MSLQKRNLRVCEVLYSKKYYDVLIAVNDLDVPKPDDQYGTHRKQYHKQYQCLF